MSERNGYDPGMPCWIDHSSTDPAAAAGFYGPLFGWETEDVMPPGGPGQYFVGRLRGRDVGAFGTQQAEGAPPTWNTYVWVEDADAALERARELGGTPMGEAFDVGDSGRMAVLQDPDGAWLCVWQAGAHRGAAIVNEPGSWCWEELNTRDVEGSMIFYGELFGWQAVPLGDDYYLWHPAGEIADDAMPFGGMRPITDATFPKAAPSHWAIAFAVADTDATAASGAELGGTVTMPPFDTPFGRTAVMGDPLGAQFSIITLQPG